MATITIKTNEGVVIDHFHPREHWDLSDNLGQMAMLYTIVKSIKSAESYEEYKDNDKRENGKNNDR